MIYQYEHFDPPFEDCKSHNPKGITLLCGSCYDKKTRLFLPQFKVKEANSNPCAKQNGYWNKLYYDTTPLIIILGNNHSYHFKDLFIVNGKKILSIAPPGTKNSPYQIIASFFNAKNKPILSINKNIISGKPSNVDITTKGEFYPHKYEPLISEPLFDKAQEVMASHNKSPIQYAGKPILFRGLITCKHCGCAVTEDIKKKKYVYYSCNNSKGICNKKWTREEKLLDSVVTRSPPIEQCI